MPVPERDIDFVGAGWSYPLGTDATGGVALVTRDREIEQAIRLILGTAVGERPMRPEFGCRIHDHVFNAASSATAGQIAYDVRQALDRWEPRIEVLDVGVSF
ncbi:MAG: GPW/gp25 family protein, partial [Propionicimonas sp.]